MRKRTQVLQLLIHKSKAAAPGINPRRQLLYFKLSGIILLGQFA
ncbi:hypothetical protein [uncultured Pontibacter sp.]|nr:hypothetical protein [uncultured Pontibacter sp.]